MIRPLILCSALVLSACQDASAPKAPERVDLSAELVRSARPGPPPAPAGTCWGSDQTPAVIETVTEQQEATAAIRSDDGRVLKPASYRTVTHQKIVRDRETIWFRTPCPEMMTVEFIATLQRALKARGYYLLALTGQLDPPTREAIRRFQEARGLDSQVLSLGAARNLGIIAADLGLGGKG